jgi:hypothetical protein
MHSSVLICSVDASEVEAEAQSRVSQAIVEKFITAVGVVFSLSESDSFDLKREVVGEEGLG